MKKNRKSWLGMQKKFERGMQQTTTDYVLLLQYLNTLRLLTTNWKPPQFGPFSQHIPVDSILQTVGSLWEKVDTKGGQKCIAVQEKGVMEKRAKPF